MILKRFLKIIIRFYKTCYIKVTLYDKSRLQIQYRLGAVSHRFEIFCSCDKTIYIIQKPGQYLSSITENVHVTLANIAHIRICSKHNYTRTTIIDIIFSPFVEVKEYSVRDS